MDKLSEIRCQIDKIDDEIVELYTKRLGLVLAVKNYKKENNMAIEQQNREGDIIARLIKNHPEKAENIKDLYEIIFRLSKELQK